MGQYQGRASKSVDEEAGVEPRAESDTGDRGSQQSVAIPGAQDPVSPAVETMFGSPMDNENFLARLESSSISEDSAPKCLVEEAPLKKIPKIIPKPVDRTIPIVFRWDSGGNEVYLTGSFNNWESKIPMTNSQGDFTAIVDLIQGRHEYKFFVDGQWLHDPTELSIDNGLGTRNNVVIVDQKHFDALFETWEMTSSDKGGGSPPGSYSQTIPPRSAASGLPPVLPPLLQQTILNQDQPYEDPTMLPQPNHVILNHLYALSIKDNVLVLAATHRYKEKYVTTLTYKPVLL